MFLFDWMSFEYFFFSINTITHFHHSQIEQRFCIEDIRTEYDDTCHPHNHLTRSKVLYLDINCTSAFLILPVSIQVEFYVLKTIISWTENSSYYQTLPSCTSKQKLSFTVYTLCSEKNSHPIFPFCCTIWCEITNDVEEKEAKNETGVTREEDRTSVSVYFTLSILVCIEFPLVENKRFYLTLSMTGPH